MRAGAAEGEPDLRVVAAPRQPRSAEAGPDRRRLSIEPWGWTLRFDNRDGDWMAYDYRSDDRRLRVSASLPWEICAEPLGGVVCAVLLGLEGRTLLHGACLSQSGSAFAILGASGQGKSTLAAALAQQGTRLVTEDLLVPARTEAGWTVEAGARSLNLLEDAYSLFGPPGPAAKRREGKYTVDLSGSARAAAPLAALYLLDRAGAEREAKLTRLSGRQALQPLLEHLYGASWIRAPEQADLSLCADLVARIPVYRLSRPWRLDQVRPTAAMLLRHAAAAPRGVAG